MVDDRMQETTEMTPNHTTPGAGLRSSAALLWRRQRLLWWLFALNLAAAWLASVPLRSVLHAVLDQSLESQRLVEGFDLATYFLLRQQPDLPGSMLFPASAVAAGLFLLVTVILSGGVIRELLEDRKLDGQEFAASCVAFFWRIVRLTLYSAVALGIVFGISAAAAIPAGKLGDHFTDGRIGDLAPMMLRLLMLLAALFVRQWFDVAQARLVHNNERKILRELWRTFRPALRSGLYWQYLGIGVLAAASFAAGLWIWAMLPHASMLAAFVVLELVTLAQVAARLWMKAASAQWVALQPEAVAWKIDVSDTEEMGTEEVNTEETIPEETARKTEEPSLPQSGTREADLPASE